MNLIHITTGTPFFGGCIIFKCNTCPLSECLVVSHVGYEKCAALGLKLRILSSLPSHLARRPRTARRVGAMGRGATRWTCTHEETRIYYRFSWEMLA